MPLKTDNIKHCLQVPLPMIVMDGLRRPFGRNRSWSSSLANGLFGFGSNGVPSIRVHGPMIVFQPRMLYKMQQCSYRQTNSRQVSAVDHWPRDARPIYNSHAKCRPTAHLQCEPHLVHAWSTVHDRHPYWFIESTHAWLTAAKKF